MKDYLNDKIKFKYLTLSKVLTFLNLVKETDKKDIEYVRRRFEKISSNFDAILSFLVQANLIKLVGRELMLIKSLDSNKVVQALLEALFKKPLFERTDIDKFIDNFVTKDEELWFYPDQRLRLKTSGIRNFLINLGFLVYDEKSGGYFISKEGSTYLPGQKIKNLTPLQFAKDLKSMEILGIAAEEAVLKYEKIRLRDFPNLLDKIKHVSKKVVNAGYDLQSHSVKKGNKDFEPRYIEVKAVSKIDHKFYWSHNELMTAKSFKNQYYLYLVPTENDGKFDMDNVVIIQNPYQNVFDNKTDWKSKTELLSFTYIK